MGGGAQGRAQRPVLRLDNWRLCPLRAASMVAGPVWAGGVSFCLGPPEQTDAGDAALGAVAAGLLAVATG